MKTFEFTLFCRKSAVLVESNLQKAKTPTGFEPTICRSVVDLLSSYVNNLQTISTDT